MSATSTAGACTGICLVSADVWPRVAAHGPNGGHSCLWHYGTAIGLIAPCGRVCGGKGATPCRPPRVPHRISNGRDDRADHRDGEEMHGDSLDIENRAAAAGTPRSTCSRQKRLGPTRCGHCGAEQRIAQVDPKRSFSWRQSRACHAASDSGGVRSVA
jgi:hypothetical protein